MFTIAACDSAKTDDGAAEAGDGDGDGGLACGEEWATKDPTSGTPDIQAAWGSACASDQECVDRLGFDNAICVQNILGVFDLPGGYCSRPCVLPDFETTNVPNDAQCDPAGGVSCIGLKDNFEACAIPCNTSDQCGREGYGCARMPIISSDADPSYCLMDAGACCQAPETCGSL